MKYTRNLATVQSKFDRDTLATICSMPEESFGLAFGLDAYGVDQKDDDFFFFQDNGASVLAVAHLDTVVYPDQRDARYIETKDGLVINSGALDDRLGAYTILDLLPATGIKYDILLTVGEESGASTAAFFKADKEYDWMIEFDRGGTDVVMYQYDDDDTRRAVRKTGARVGDGIFSDISYMEHVGIKGFNWGVGYRDYHSTRGHAYIDDYQSMIARYLKFHQQNAGVAMPHEFVEKPIESDWWGNYRSSNYGSGNWWNNDDEYFDQSVEHGSMSDHRTGFGPVDDDPYYSESIYSEADYNEDPTIEEIQRALERMDDEDAAYMARNARKIS